MRVLHYESKRPWPVSTERSTLTFEDCSSWRIVQELRARQRMMLHFSMLDADDE